LLEATANLAGIKMLATTKTKNAKQYPYLKPCPFCGNEVFIEETVCDTYVRCTYSVCRCLMSVKTGQDSGNKKAIKNLTKKWNKRREKDT
jgi:hypothetical protein